MRKSAFFVTIAFFLSCRTVTVVDHSTGSQYVMSDSAVSKSDSSLNAFIEPYRETVKQEMNVVLGESIFSLEKGLPESRLGNFVSDACLQVAKEKNVRCDFAVFNSGGLRRALPSGYITKGDVYELMPFENTLVTLKLSGRQTDSLLNFIASKGGAPVSGIRFKIADKKFSEATINGLAFNIDSSYTVLTSDFLANGGDGFFSPGETEINSSGIKVRDAIIQYITSLSAQGKKITTDTDGRITNGK